jgi:hypothetical protein
MIDLYGLLLMQIHIIIAVRAVRPIHVETIISEWECVRTTKVPVEDCEYTAGRRMAKRQLSGQMGST